MDYIWYTFNTMMRTLTSLLAEERGSFHGAEETNITFVEFEELFNAPHVRSFFQPPVHTPRP